MNRFPFYHQPDTKDCGPTCLKIIAKFYGKTISIQKLRNLSETQRAGSNLLYLSQAAEAIGFRSIGVKITFSDIINAPLPCILHWNKKHYVVLYKIKKDSFYISDPAHGLIKYTKEEFLKYWIGANATESTEEGIALLLEPTPKFYENEFEEKKKLSLSFLSKYLFKYKKFIWQLVFGLIAGSILQLIFPFLILSSVYTLHGVEK